MSAFLNYVMEANIGLLLVWVVYEVLLRRENQFRLARIYLLTGIVASLTFPLIHIDTGDHGIPGLSGILLASEFWASSGAVPEASVKEGYNWQKLFIGIYLSGIGLFLVLLLIRISRLIRVLRSGTVVPYGSYRVIESEKNIPSFSFLHYIFIGMVRTLSPADKQQIIRHESIHIQQRHSIDILLVNLVHVVFWFNPVLVIYKKIFVQLHEFEADARAVENGDVDKYCNLLARVALQSADISLANHFNNSLTVKRIQMMRTLKTKIGIWKGLGLAAVLPLLFVVLACQEQVSEKNGTDQPTKIRLVEPVYDNVEQMPQYKGGFDAMASFIQRHLKYPEKSKKENVAGMVFVSFVVEKDGSLSEVNVMKGVNEELDAEAVRVVKLFHNWEPGMKDGKVVRTKMILPIKFQL